MNILLYDLVSYTQKDLIYYLERAGHHCRNVVYIPGDTERDPFLEHKWNRLLKEGSYDIVISFNFFAPIAKACHENNTKYLAWTYDSPCGINAVKRNCFDTTYLFIFDKKEYNDFVKEGIPQVYYLPLAVNTARLDRVVPDRFDKQIFTCDISFVGRLYLNNIGRFMEAVSEEDSKKIDALIEKQRTIYGKNIISEEMTDEYCKTLLPQLAGSDFNTDTFSPLALRNEVLKEVTRRDRTELLRRLSKNHAFTFFSPDPLPEHCEKIKKIDGVNYYTEMPCAFKLSTLNINSSLRSIESAIPLRALDIMGCGGVLFSAFQPEIDEYFTDGEECILFRSMDEAVEKADHYLSHIDKCKDIAKKAHAKIERDFNYPDRIQTMFETAGLL
ncbi:MAG: DUF3880 domain-containing protein [Lachnospiraceae bacterium]|nr:DUF3880 domain-containing protein [Lachnospiraceae bacterium]